MDELQYGWCLTLFPVESLCQDCVFALVGDGWLVLQHRLEHKSIKHRDVRIEVLLLPHLRDAVAVFTARTSESAFYSHVRRSITNFKGGQKVYLGLLSDTRKP